MKAGKICVFLETKGTAFSFWRSGYGSFDSLSTAAGLAQSVERLPAEREFAGSIPGTGPTPRVLN